MSIRVLHLIDSGGLYGAERMLLALVEAQQALGIEPMILSAGEPGIEPKAIEMEAERRGLPVKIWRMRAGLNKSETRRICEWAEEWGADVLHSHGYKFNILLGFFGSFKKHVPLVTTLHGYVHAPRFSRMWVYELLDRFVLRKMDRVVLVGESMKKELPFILRGSSRVSVIRNGLKLEDTLQQAEEPIPDYFSDFFAAHDPVILGVGRLSPEKQFGKLVSSFSLLKEEFPNAGLIIAGEGMLREALEKDINRLGLERNVLLPGYCENVPGLMSRAGLLVISSSTEGLPITLLEAMALRVPIVATSVGEIPGVLEDGCSGVLVGEPESELTEALFASITEPTAARERSERAYKRVFGELSAASMAEQYATVYRRAAGV